MNKEKNNSKVIFYILIASVVISVESCSKPLNEDITRNSNLLIYDQYDSLISEVEISVFKALEKRGFNYYKIDINAENEEAYPYFHDKYFRYYDNKVYVSKLENDNIYEDLIFDYKSKKPDKLSLPNTHEPLTFSYTLGRKELEREEIYGIKIHCETSGEPNSIKMEFTTGFKLLTMQVFVHDGESLYL